MASAAGGAGGSSSSRMASARAAQVCRAILVLSRSSAASPGTRSASCWAHRAARRSVTLATRISICPSAQHPGGGGVGEAEVVADPCAHRGGPVDPPFAAAIDGRQRDGELGGEGGLLLCDFGHGGAGGWDVEGLDGGARRPREERWATQSVSDQVQPTDFGHGGELLP